MTAPPYCLVNLLDDIQPTHGERFPGVTGRFGRETLESRDLGVSHWHYAPNARSLIAHSHREQEEAFVVVAGSGRALLDADVLELRQWDVVRVAPQVVRAFAAGPDGLELIAVGGPRPDGGDGIQVDAQWPG